MKHSRGMTRAGRGARLAVASLSALLGAVSDRSGGARRGCRRDARDGHVGPAPARLHGQLHLQQPRLPAPDPGPGGQPEHAGPGLPEHRRPGRIRERDVLRDDEGGLMRRFALTAAEPVLVVGEQAAHSLGLDEPFDLRVRPSCDERTATIIGSARNDVVRGSQEPDVIDAERGDDVVRGDGSDDAVCGNMGQDELSGGPSDDELFGGEDDRRQALPEVLRRRPLRLAPVPGAIDRRPGHPGRARGALLKLRGPSAHAKTRPRWLYRRMSVSPIRRPPGGLAMPRKLTVATPLALLALALPAPAFADSLEQLAPTPTTYTAGVDFAEMSGSGAGDITAPLTAVDLVVPSPRENGSTSGCEASDFAGFPAGAIALLQRGTCLFREKALNAQAAGATGVVIFNEGSPAPPERTALLRGALLEPPVTLPVVGATFAVGNELRNGVLTGPTGVVVRLATDGDTTGPVITVPDTITVPATSPAGAVVEYTVDATDNTDPDPTVRCDPPSGSTFAIGTTTVRCRATDADGNLSEPAEFDVVVLSADRQLEDLAADLAGSDLPAATRSSLGAKLEAARRALARGATEAACNQLAAFTNEVRAQSGKKIPESEATDLIAAAEAIRAALGC